MRKDPSKIISENRLFWFLREGTEINLQDKSQLDLYLQQILSHGKAEDVRELLQTISPQTFRESFGRIKGFLKEDIRTFWGEYLESLV